MSICSSVSRTRQVGVEKFWFSTSQPSSSGQGTKTEWKL